MHIRKNIARRRFLQGVGGSFLALPILDAHSDNGSIAPPKRITATGVFYGFVPENFHPQETGSEFKAPLLLKSLEPLRQDYTVFSGLDHNLTGGHSSTKFFLSGIPSSQSKGFAESNISVDQKAANFVGGQTRYPLLRLIPTVALSTPFHGQGTVTTSSPSEVWKRYTNCFFEKTIPRLVDRQRKT